MKKITIGKEEYDLCENVDDIFDVRFPVFINYMRMGLEGIDKTLFFKTREEAFELADKGMLYRALKKYDDYYDGIRLEQVNETGFSMCFALICLEKDEDQTNTSEGFLKKKLKKMRKDGLKRGTVEGAVTNFIKGSPNSFGDLAILVEMMQKET